MYTIFFVCNILFLSVGGEGGRLVEAADAHLFVLHDIIIIIIMVVVYNILFLSVGGEGARLIEAADAHLVYYI